MSSYHATSPIPFNEIALGSQVSVPEWKLGEVIGWVTGTVIELAPTREEAFLVRLANGTEAIYFDYSIGR